MKVEARSPSSPAAAAASAARSSGNSPPTARGWWWRTSTRPRAGGRRQDQRRITGCRGRGRRGRLRHGGHSRPDPSAERDFGPVDLYFANAGIVGGTRARRQRRRLGPCRST